MFVASLILDLLPRWPFVAALPLACTPRRHSLTRSMVRTTDQSPQGLGFPFRLNGSIRGPYDLRAVAVWGEPTRRLLVFKLVLCL